MKTKSLERELLVSIFYVLLFVLALFAGFVFYNANNVSEKINAKALEGRADDLVNSLTMSGGSFSLKPGSRFETDFPPGNTTSIYFLKFKSGKVILASDPKVADFATTWENGTEGRQYIEINGVFKPDDVFYGIAEDKQTDLGDIIVVVGQSGEKLDFANYILYEFLEDVAWLGPLVIILVGFTVALVVRREFNALNKASQKVENIYPQHQPIQLDTGNFPIEIVPFVDAINKALARLEKSYNAERRFTVNAAHELRTPLSVLKARVDSLKTSPSKKSLNELQNDIDLMARIVNQLLVYAKLELRGEEEENASDINAIARDVVSYYAPLAVSKRQDISASLPKSPVWVEADYSKVYEAVKNLVENSIKHCPAKAKISVRLDKKGELKVIDNGPGVPAEFSEMIFERFYRRKASETPESGAGLGLSLVKEIARKFNGSVRLEKTPGGGATFVLRLPLGKPPPEATATN